MRTIDTRGQNPVSYTHLLSAKKVYLLAWGEEKAKMVKECVEGNVTDTIPASYLQTHNNAHIAIDLSAAANLTRIQRP